MNSFNNYIYVYICNTSSSSNQTHEHNQDQSESGSSINLLVEVSIFDIWSETQMWQHQRRKFMVIPSNNRHDSPGARAMENQLAENI